MSVFRTGIPAWSVIVSIALHVGAVALFDWSRGGLISVVSAPVHVRLVPAPGSLPPNSGPVADEEPPGFQVLELSRQRQTEKPSAIQGVQTNRDSALLAGHNPLVRANSGDAYFNVADYVPRAYLSTGPEPLSAIEVRPPVDISGKFAVTIELSLFIDEFGKVQKLRVETPDVAPPFVEAAMRAFEGVAFKPGLLDGKPVRSLIRVAVDFVQD